MLGITNQWYQSIITNNHGMSVYLWLKPTMLPFAIAPFPLDHYVYTYR